MTAAVVVHICEFSSTAMFLLVADREIPENHTTTYLTILSAPKSAKKQF